MTKLSKSFRLSPEAVDIIKEVKDHLSLSIGKPSDAQALEYALRIAKEQIDKHKR